MAPQVPYLGQILKETYRIDRKIGEGGPAIVFQGTDLQLKTPIAIKYLRPRKKKEKKELQRFLREARTQSRLFHDNIVRIRVVLEEKQNYFIVMEYVPGHDLEIMIQRSRGKPCIHLRNVKTIFAQVLQGLQFAHDNDVYHRDVKPANILIAPGLRTKIADFGIARVLNEPKLTTSGVAMGTPRYVAPEQIQNLAPDHRLDIYSVGITLYESLSGLTPFEEPERRLDMREILRRHLMDPPPPLASRGIEVPAALEQIIQRCLQKRPQQRYQSCNEVRDDLLQALHHI